MELVGDESQKCTNFKDVEKIIPILAKTKQQHDASVGTGGGGGGGWAQKRRRGRKITPRLLRWSVGDGHCLLPMVRWDTRAACLSFAAGALRVLPPTSQGLTPRWYLRNWGRTNCEPPQSLFPLAARAGTRHGGWWVVELCYVDWLCPLPLFPLTCPLPHSPHIHTRARVYYLDIAKLGHAFIVN